MCAHYYTSPTDLSRPSPRDPVFNSPSTGTHSAVSLVLPADQFGMLTPNYSPDTTVAITLRNFEKSAKSQAETEYDKEHDAIPPAPADDDLSVSPDLRKQIKKRRKVRSAIVSRRKNAIYVEKLEKELDLRDNINSELTTRLSIYRDVLRDIQSKIDAMKGAVSAAAATAAANAAPQPSTSPVHVAGSVLRRPRSPNVQLISPQQAPASAAEAMSGVDVFGTPHDVDESMYDDEDDHDAVDDDHDDDHSAAPRDAPSSRRDHAAEQAHNTDHDNELEEQTEASVAAALAENEAVNALLYPYLSPASPTIGLSASTDLAAAAAAAMTHAALAASAGDAPHMQASRARAADFFHSAPDCVMQLGEAQARSGAQPGDDGASAVTDFGSECSDVSPVSSPTTAAVPASSDAAADAHLAGLRPVAWPAALHAIDAATCDASYAAPIPIGLL